MKTFLDTVKAAVVVVLVTAVVTAGLALAQTPPAEAPAVDHGGSSAPLADLAGFLGMEPGELREELVAGATLAEVAAARGISREELVGHIVDAVTERVETAYGAGRVDAQRRERILADLEGRVEAGIDTPRPWRDRVRRARRVRRVAAGIVTDLLNMEPAELREALTGGATLAEVAEERGVDVDDLVAALLAPLSDRLQAAVEAGRLTDEERDAALARAEERVRERVSTPSATPRHRRAALRRVAEVLGLEPGEVREALDGGATLADLVEDAGLGVDEFVDAVLQPVADRLDAAVAAGRIGADEAATKLAALRERLLDRLR